MLRNAPELKFVPDDQLAYSGHLMELTQIYVRALPLVTTTCSCENLHDPCFSLTFLGLVVKLEAIDQHVSSTFTGLYVILYQESFWCLEL